MKKIAVMMHGMAGNTNKYGTGKKVDTVISHKHFVENILSLNDQCQIDIFMHSWSIESQTKLVDLYSPVSFLFEEQIHFDFDYVVGNPELPMNEGKTENGFFKGAQNIRFHSLFSRWYSAKSVNRLRKIYELDHGIKYDMVVLTRFDLAYLYPFDFSLFSDENIHIIGPPSHHGFHDILFLGGDHLINKLCEMFDFVSSIKHFSNWNMHSHWLVANWILREIGEESIRFIGPERLWDAGLQGAKTGPAPLVRDHYDLFQINKDDPLEKVKVHEIQRASFEKFRQYSEMIK